MNSIETEVKSRRYTNQSASAVLKAEPAAKIPEVLFEAAALNHSAVDVRS